MKKVSLIVVSIFSLLAITQEASLLQMVPFFIYLFLGYLNVYKKSRNEVWIVSLAVFMGLLNILEFSILDIIVWLMIGLSHRGLER